MNHHNNINTHLSGIQLLLQENGSWNGLHIWHIPCDDHFVGPLLWGEKCSPLLWRVGESLPSSLSPRARPRLRPSAKSCRESSVGGGAGGGGSSAYDRSTVINKLSFLSKWKRVVTALSKSYKIHLPTPLTCHIFVFFKSIHRSYYDKIRITDTKWQNTNYQTTSGNEQSGRGHKRLHISL